MRRWRGCPASRCRCPMPPTWKSWRCLRSRKWSRRPRPSATGDRRAASQTAIAPPDGARQTLKGGPMPINILMPALSPTMEKGNLAKWLKKEGDKVKTGDILAEIETDKATMEYEAVDDGTLAKILVPEGTQDVSVNDVIAVLAGDGEDVKAAGASAASAPPKAAPAAEAPA